MPRANTAVIKAQPEWRSASTFAMKSSSGKNKQTKQKPVSSDYWTIF